MEFTNEIFFNKPLTVGNTVIITYSGKLYREHSKDVSIVFGYGDNWAETDNAPMKETENGFEVTLTIKNYNTFNFCFTNSFNIWDNNFGFNYISSIEPMQENNNNKDNSNEIDNNHDISNNIDDNQEDSNESDTNQDISEQDDNLNKDEASQENKIEESSESNSDNTANFENNEKDDNIDAIFSSLLDTLLDDTNKDENIDLSDLSGFGLQSVEEIDENDVVNCDEIFAELFKELTFDKENISNEHEIVENTQQENSNSEENIKTAELPNYNNYEVQELDNLMDNLLASISNNSEISSYATPIQEINKNEKVDLPAVPDEQEDWIDKIINISSTVTKRISTACKKFGALIKLKAKELGLISDDK